MNEQAAVVETPVVEESFEAYVTRANAAEQTGTLDAAETPVAEAVAVVEDPAVAETAKPKGKPRSDPQARIDQAIAQKSDADRRAQEADARAARLEAELAATRAPKAAPVAEVAAPAFPEYGEWAAKPGNETKPYEAYIDARTDWRYDQRQRAEQTTKAEQAIMQRLDASNTAFRDRLTKDIADEPEFLETVDSRLAEAPRLSAFVRRPDGAFVERGTNRPLQAPTFVNFLSEQIFLAEHPKALLRHLSDPQEVQRLATLPPDEVIRALAKLDVPSVPAAASTRGPAQKAQKSQAPDPITPLGSSPLGTADEPGDDEPFEQFVRRENARDRKAGRL